MSSSDWIEGYKLGFKEGVIALKTQLEKIAYKKTLRTIFNEYITYYIGEETLDEICKELEGENG